MTHVALKLQKISPQSFRSLGLNEAWLQQQILDDPSLLVWAICRSLSASAFKNVGRTHRLFDGGLRESDARYEIEVMLGPVDESHIIRTIEYWDVERQRYPISATLAVIVAEEITSRFF